MIRTGVFNFICMFICLFVALISSSELWLIVAGIHFLMGLWWANTDDNQGQELTKNSMWGG